MKKEKGFTLVEMLIVIVLIGLITTLAIPSVIKVMENRANDEYKAQLKITEQAASLYQTRYRGEFNNNPTANCFILDYKVLLEEDLIDELDTKCSGKIVYTRNSKNNFTKKLYLKCIDKNSAVVGDNNKNVPSGCVTLGIDYSSNSVTLTAPTIKGGNDNWVPTNIDITVEDSGIDLSEVDHYDYYMSSNGLTPSSNVTVSGTTKNKVTISAQGTTYIWYRVVNKNGDTSNWSNRQVANIDKTTPSNPTITPSDNITSGTQHSDDFTLTFGGSNNISGNTYYYGTTDNPTEIASALSVTSENNGTTYYVKVCSGANICSGISSYLVKY